jgi:hypothetical protein
MLLDFTAMHVPIPGSSTSSQQHKHCLRYFASSLTSLQRKSCQFLATVLPPRYTQSHIPFSRTALHLRCQSAGGRGSGQWRRRPWHGLPCRALARDLPGTALHVASRYPTTQPSTTPHTCAVALVGEVEHGVVNHPSIHGKDGVAGSIPAGGSTHALTSANAGQSPSQAVAAGHIRSGMGSKGQRAVRAPIALLTSNFGRGVAAMAPL